MPIYLDHHRKVFEPKPEMFTEAHKRDLDKQEKFGVQFQHCWYDARAGHMFCISTAPNREAVADLHRENGWDLMEIYEVVEA